MNVYGKINISSKTSLTVRGATTVGLGMWYSRQSVPRVTKELIRDDMKAMKQLRERRNNIKRIPSIYISVLAQKTLGKVKENV